MTEIALSLVDPHHLSRLSPLHRLTVADCGAALGWRSMPFAGALDAEPVTRLHLGSDCCERLLPRRAELQAAVDFARSRGLGLALACALMADAALHRLPRLLALLPAGSEVVANDWGALRLIGREFPALVPVAGRLLCKMVKDPRLPSAEWMRLYPHGIHAAPFGAVLARLGVQRLEMDVPPFAQPADLAGGEVPIAVHAPFGIATKGRSCRIAGLGRAETAKFVAGGRCTQECLHYTTTLDRPGAAQDLPTRLRGTAMLYAHAPGMAAAVLEAARLGTIDRIILSGDWH